MIRFLAVANLAAAFVLSLVFVVLQASPNADVVLDRASGGNLGLLLGPVYPFIVLGSLLSPLVIRALCLLLILVLTAAGVGLWREEPWATRIELGLLAGGAACLFGSAAILLVIRPAGSVLHLALAVLMAMAAWRIVPAAIDRRRVAFALAAALLASLLIFGGVAAYILKGLSGLR